MINVIFSINVHESIKFLLYQLQNIKQYVKVSYIVIINCNKTMLNILNNNKSIKLMKNVILYPKYLKKKRFHGSITNGICLNMKFALNYYKFEYFIILSSRNIFYNEFNSNNYNKLLKITGIKYETIKKDDWWWPTFLNTKLSKYFIEQDKLFSFSAHEGLTFDYESCKSIIYFIFTHKDIMEELFNYEACVEEFSLQSICVNESGYYYDIGNGCGRHDNQQHTLPKNKYVYKVYRFK